MRFQIKAEDDKGTFVCTVDDINPTHMSDAIHMLSVAFDKLIELRHQSKGESECVEV